MENLYTLFLEPKEGLVEYLKFLACVLISVNAIAGTKIHGLSARGVPKYGPHFTHFDFVNPNAPKKGTIAIGELGSFDSLNPWILKGVAAKKINLTRATLLGRAPDEPFTMYGVVAESVECPEDRSWIIFHIRPSAKWDTGDPITADDVIYSHKAWLQYGQPFMKTFYQKVERVEKLGPLSVKFTFKEDQKDREQPLIIGMMPLLPEKVYKGKDLNELAMQPLVSNGPYRIKAYEAGRYIVYERVKNFWGKDLPTYKGRYNFDEVRIDYFLSRPILFEAFKSGKIDVIEEDDPQRWHQDYNFSKDKDIEKVEIPHKRPVGLHSFVFNTRRDLFRDLRVRQALEKIFNFEHINRTIYHQMYTRTRSFFDRTELMPQGKPSAAEARILKSYGLNPDDMTLNFSPAVNQSGQAVRQNLQDAAKLLNDAGYEIVKGMLVHKDTKARFEFELIVPTKEWEKVAVSFSRDAARLGIRIQVRLLDEAQYQRRKVDFDFDMIYHFWLGTRSPGNELINYISSQAADINGSRNYPGIRSPVIDDLIRKIIRTDKRHQLIHLVKVLDRVLMSGHYVIPLFHLEKDLIAYKKGYDYPELDPAMESRIESWWKI